MEQELYLITLHVPTSLEEALVDSLLTFEAEQGFSSLLAFTHDHKNEGLTVAEQVTGRQKKIRFQMNIDKNDLSALLKMLTAEYSGAGITYWVTPVIRKGTI